MALSRVRGQDQVARMFSGILAKDRLAHAYLFLGPSGVGKATFARELAKAILCPKAGHDACDSCPACHRFDAGRHGDFHLVQPEAGKRAVSINDVRTLESAVALRAVEGGHKVFVIEDADRMTVEASNAFLKTLEEPPPKSLLILIVESLDAMLDTIVSRCHVVRFRPIANPLVAEMLREEHGVAPGEAAAVANFAGGSMGRAVDLIECEAQEHRAWMRQVAVELTPGHEFDVAEKMLESAKKHGGTLEDTRSRLAELLHFLMLYYRDLLTLRASGRTGSVFNIDQRAELEAQADAWPPARLEFAVSRVLDALDQIWMNVNVSLVVENLLVDLARGHGPSPALRA